MRAHQYPRVALLTVAVAIVLYDVTVLAKGLLV